MITNFSVLHIARNPTFRLSGAVANVVGWTLSALALEVLVRSAGVSVVAVLVADVVITRLALGNEPVFAAQDV